MMRKKQKKIITSKNWLNIFFIINHNKSIGKLPILLFFVLYLIKEELAMRKMTTAGLITTGLVGAVGLAYAMTDKRMRNKMANDGKKMLDKAGDMVSKMDIF